jgi:phenylacetate-CoA ligase
MANILLDQLMRFIFGERGRRLMNSPQGLSALRSAQNLILKRQMAYIAGNSPFYQKKFAEEGISPGNIRSIPDLPKLGFFTYPDDIKADPFQFLAVPRQRIVHIMSSSGTTGVPKTVFLTKEDWDKTVGVTSTGLQLLGVTDADVAQILFSYGNPSWPTGSVLQSALEQIETFILPMGNSAPLARQIEMMQLFGTTILLGTPSYLHRLTEEGSKLCDLRELKVHTIRLAAEPWSEAMRTYLGEAWGAEVFDTYSMVELGLEGAGECSARDGLHISPNIAVEVVEPKSGELLPRCELGELVYTQLTQKGSPLLRYRSGDLGSLLPSEPCPCGGIPTERISRIVGRVDDMLFLGGGENAFPSQFETSLINIDGVTGFQVIIDKVSYQDRLTIRVETIVPPSDELGQAIRHNLYNGLSFLEHEIKAAKMIAPLEIEFLKPGTLQSENSNKIRLLVDKRE